MRNFNRFLKVGTGDFVVSPKPRGGDWLDTDLRALKQQGFTLVVSLLTTPETRELALSDQAHWCRTTGIEFYRFPIVDRSVPSNPESFQQFVSKIHSRLIVGGRGFFHCRAGLGRAPLLGSSILIEEGYSAEGAWRAVEDVRGQPVPDTNEQKSWVEGRASSRSMSLDDALSSLLES